MNQPTVGLRISAYSVSGEWSWCLVSLEGLECFDASISSAAGGEDRLHQTREHVVDVPGNGDAWGNRGCGAETLDVARDGRRRVEDGVLAQGRPLDAYEAASVGYRNLLSKLLDRLADRPESRFRRATAMFGLAQVQAKLDWLDEVRPILLAEPCPESAPC